MRLVFISPATATTALRITSAVKASMSVLSVVGIIFLSFTERHEIPLNDLCYPGPNVHFCLTPSRRAFTDKSAEHSPQNKRDYLDGERPKVMPRAELNPATDRWVRRSR